MQPLPFREGFNQNNAGPFFVFIVNVAGFVVFIE
jgi:hypothetical protein